ncbi:hypothetical protein [Streptomyces filamentosus]|uniref:hypothetical protein n=1 Tax=Streptomyces filamentosus TaxID=67294 RepID=UPI0037D2C7C3
MLLALVGCAAAPASISPPEAAEVAFPCLGGSEYSPITGATVTMATETITVHPSADGRPLILMSDTPSGRWRAADVVSQQILGRLGCEV